MTTSATPPPADAPPVPLTDPARDWDETPAEAAAADRAWDANDHDIHRDEDS